mgnify:FL=1
MYPTPIFDHSKSVDDFKRYGISVFEPYKDDKFERKKTFGRFEIYPFELVHDVPCFGFYIRHTDMGSFVYLSDTEYCKYRFPRVNHILVEANYDKRIIDSSHPAKEHILRGHLELQTTKDFISANKTPDLRNIILCHLSSENADPETMQKEVQSVAGKWVRVDVAKAGMTVELSKYPW